MSSVQRGYWVGAFIISMMLHLFAFGIWLVPGWLIKPKFSGEAQQETFVVNLISLPAVQPLSSVSDTIEPVSNAAMPLEEVSLVELKPSEMISADLIESEALAIEPIETLPAEDTVGDAESATTLPTQASVTVMADDVTQTTSSPIEVVESTPVNPVGEGQANVNLDYAREVLFSIQQTPQIRHSRPGRVHLRFDILADGNVGQIIVSRSSGDQSLDAIAIAHIQRSSPFPAPPDKQLTQFSFEYVATTHSRR